MRVLICGGREYDNWIVFKQEVNKVCGHTRPVIISGGAKGADFLARIYAKCYSLDYEEYPANWKKYGNRAGPIRNQQMLDEGKPDLVIAFPGGRGTKDMISRARNAGVEIKEIDESLTYPYGFEFYETLV
jgi:UDP-N-acetylmuramoylalanine-D-glutamate ligase